MFGAIRPGPIQPRERVPGEQLVIARPAAPGQIQRLRQRDPRRGGIAQHRQGVPAQACRRSAQPRIGARGGDAAGLGDGVGRPPLRQGAFGQPEVRGGDLAAFAGRGVGVQRGLEVPARLGEPRLPLGRPADDGVGESGLGQRPEACSTSSASLAIGSARSWCPWSDRISATLQAAIAALNSSPTRANADAACS